MRNIEIKAFLKYGIWSKDYQHMFQCWLNNTDCLLFKLTDSTFDNSIWEKQVHTPRFDFPAIWPDPLYSIGATEVPQKWASQMITLQNHNSANKVVECAIM